MTNFQNLSLVISILNTLTIIVLLVNLRKAKIEALRYRKNTDILDIFEEYHRDIKALLITTIMLDFIYVVIIFKNFFT